MHFAPTSTFQEHSIQNGWADEYLILASRFDKICEDSLKNAKTYLQFEMPKGSDDVKILKKNLFKRIVINLLTMVLPKANPDFEEKIREVSCWMVEFNSKTGAPEREIGLNKEGAIIVKMPWNENYGYWTDNNLLLNDFEDHFNASEITRKIFEDNWQLIE